MRSRKERAKELEGIDMSNIVSSTIEGLQPVLLFHQNPKYQISVMMMKVKKVMGMTVMMMMMTMKIMMMKTLLMMATAEVKN